MSDSSSMRVLIPDGESHFSLGVVTCLARIPGTRVHVVSSDPKARVRFSRFCSSFEIAQPGDDPEARLDAVIRVAERRGVDVILPACETGTVLLQSYEEGLETLASLPPFPDAESLAIASDKWRLAQFLTEHHIAVPPTVLYVEDPRFTLALQSIPFPVLIKPTHGTGGLGIRGFKDRWELLGFLRTHPEMSGRYLVQSYVPGRDIDCSVIARAGKVLAHTVQWPLTDESPTDLTRSYAPATSVELGDHPQTLALARRLVEALGWNGIANFDFRLDERNGRLYVLEINPRFWSSLVASRAAGVNFPHLACLAARDVSFPIPMTRNLRFLQAKAALVAAGRFVRPGGEKNAAPETSIWPYLIADPLPHVFGRIVHGQPYVPPVPMEEEERLAEAA